MANKSKQVSTMIKQGYISPPFLPSPRPKPKPSTSLFQVMSQEQTLHTTNTKLRDRISRLLAGDPFGNPNGVGDVKVTITGRDGYSVAVKVHRTVLARRSRFFAEKLRGDEFSHSVDICDCDDVEVYVHAFVLMYCEDVKKKLMSEDVSKVLGLLKVCSAILFDDGIISCLEYLETVPWSEQEEENIISHLTDLHLDNSTYDVLNRVSSEPSTSSGSDEIFSTLITSVLQAKNDKASKQMKTLISQLLKQNSTNNNLDISKHTLYDLCQTCLSSLTIILSEAANVDEKKQNRGVLMSEIAKEAENLQWVVDILIEKKMGDDFVRIWADQKEISILHSNIPTMYRHEISKITAQLCIALGRGLIFVDNDTRFCLLATWLEALYDDFGWMRRAGRSVDKKLVENGLSQTILTLSLTQQQTILLKWFDRFLNKGDDCPNIQRAFEVWWRRAFVRPYVPDSHMQIAVCDYQN